MMHGILATRWAKAKKLMVTPWYNRLGPVPMIAMMLLLGMISLVPSASAQGLLTREQCEAMDADSSGFIEDYEEDHFYWDLPDFNNNGTQGDQEDQDTAQAFCNTVLADSEPTNTLQVVRTELGCNGSALLAFDPTTVEGGEIVEVTITGSPSGVVLDQTTLTLASGELVAENFTVDNSGFGDYELVALNATYQVQPLAETFAQCEATAPPPDLAEQVVSVLKRILSGILNQ